jgi:hypothetical protein
LGLELFGDAFTCRHLFYQLKEHILRLFVQAGKITVQLASDLQLCVQCLPIASGNRQNEYRLAFARSKMPFPSAIAMKKNVQMGKKLHWTLTDPMQE